MKKATIKAKDELEAIDLKERTNMDDLVMWYRIGHFLRYVGAALLVLGFATFCMALAVHGFDLPRYTKTLLILVAVFGAGGIVGGNCTIASVYTDPEWTGEKIDD